ncbi:MAG: DUF1826 domain-containing protein [Planctomycetota bacterium]
MKTTTEACLKAWDQESLTRFAAGDADILVLGRPTLGGLATLVEAARVREYLTPFDRQSVGREVRAGLGELKIRSTELAADLVNLANSFVDQFDLQQARLRIEVTRSQSCPKFHCDNVNVRLVTTYVGPTTEYQYAGECITHRAPLGGLVFLKGHRHPTHGDTVHHRSPEVPIGERRLCVAIDF